MDIFLLLFIIVIIIIISVISIKYSHVMCFQFCIDVVWTCVTTRGINLNEVFSYISLIILFIFTLQLTFQVKILFYVHVFMIILD